MNSEDIVITAASLIGVAGGLLGTYFSIKNTNGPREKVFMIGWAVSCWIGVGIFLAVMFFVPQVRIWIWLPYCILLVLASRYANRWRYEDMNRRASNHRLKPMIHVAQLGR